MVNEYLDSNELYLLDAPSAEEDPYNSCYMNDAEMNASLKDLFNNYVADTIRSISRVIQRKN